MVKYLHIALDENLYDQLIIVKGKMTWIEFLEDRAYGTATQYTGKNFYQI